MSIEINGYTKRIPSKGKVPSRRKSSVSINGAPVTKNMKVNTTRISNPNASIRPASVAISFRINWRPMSRIPFISPWNGNVMNPSGVVDLAQILRDQQSRPAEADASSTLMY